MTGTRKRCPASFKAQVAGGHQADRDPRRAVQEGMRSTLSRSVNGRNNFWTASNRCSATDAAATTTRARRSRPKLPGQSAGFKMEVEWLKKKTNASVDLQRPLNLRGFLPFPAKR